jgi:predicted kinase
MVNGLPGSGKSTLAPRLANGLGAAFLSPARVEEALADAVVTDLPDLGAVAMKTVWLLAAHVGGTVVIDSWWFRPRDLEHARAGLAASGATGALEIWCDVPPEVARNRVIARSRRPDIHPASDQPVWPGAEPLALSEVIRVDTRRPVDAVALTDRVRAALWA